MTDNLYRKSPITEAVIELRSNKEIDSKKRKKAVKAFTKEYDQHKQITSGNVDISIDPINGEATTTLTKKFLDKLSSNDMTQQLIIAEQSLGISQLAPYGSWSNFKARVSRDWAVWNDSAGFLVIEQIGMRFINRIDIPAVDGTFQHTKYVSVYPKIPNFLSESLGHTINVQFNLTDIEATLNLNVARTDSPLPNNAAILLDIDITKRFENPPNEESIFQCLDSFRTKKNEIFESCVTDAAREIFEREHY